MSAIALATTVGTTLIGGLMAPDAPDQTASNNANNAAAAASQQQAQIAQDQWNTYKNTYLPLEKDYVDQAKDYGSIANQNKAASEAAATNSASYASARDRLNRSLGVNPNSQAYLQEVNRSSLAEAAGSAAAQTGARQQVKDTGNAMLVNALNLGKGLPGTASSGLGSSASGSLAAGQAGFNQGQQTYQNGLNAVGGMTKAIGGVFQSKPVQNWLAGNASGNTNFDGSLTMQNGNGFVDTPSYLIQS